jgi:hypothetical protein
MDQLAASKMALDPAQLAMPSRPSESSASALSPGAVSGQPTMLLV